MPRFYLPPEAWSEQPALVGDEARHVSQVLRMQPGGEIIVFDGKGNRANAQITKVSRERVDLTLGAIRPGQMPVPTITLAQAIPKGKNMDLVVQKSVELGVSAIQPLVTRHTVVQPGNRKSEKWRRNALEACKQCGQDTLPCIAEPRDFDDWIPNTRDLRGLKIIASLAPGATPLREILRARPDTMEATLLIGPEGDFSPGETSAAFESGFIPASLGSIILRVETAAIFCLSSVRYEFDRQSSKKSLL